MLPLLPMHQESRKHPRGAAGSSGELSLGLASYPFRNLFIKIKFICVYL